MGFYHLFLDNENTTLKKAFLAALKHIFLKRVSENFKMKPIIGVLSQFFLLWI